MKPQYIGGGVSVEYDGVEFRLYVDCIDREVMEVYVGHREIQSLIEFANKLGWRFTQIEEVENVQS